jgi:hypothetical protein
MYIGGCCEKLLISNEHQLEEKLARCLVAVDEGTCNKPSTTFDNKRHKSNLLAKKPGQAQAHCD